MLVSFHVCEGVVADREDVGRHLAHLLVPVVRDVLARVDGKDLVRIDRYQDRTCVCL